MITDGTNQLLQVTNHLLADYRQNPGTCNPYGTVIPAS